MSKETDIQTVSKAPDTLKKARRHYLIFTVLSCLLLYSLSVFVFAPLYSRLYNDTVYKTSWLVYIPELSLDLLEILVYTVAFSAIVYVLHIFSAKKALSFFFCYIGLVTLRRVASLAIGILVNSSLDILELQSAIAYIALEAVNCLVILLFAARRASRYYEDRLQRKKLRERLGDEISIPTLYPFESSFSKSNPLQASAMFAALLITAERLLSRIISDLFWGAPTSPIEILIMMIYYLLDIFFGLLIYMGMLGLFHVMHAWADRLEKKDAEAVETTSAENENIT